MSNVVKGKVHEDFSYSFFVFINSLLACFILFVFWIVLPQSVWLVQIHSPFWKLLVVFISMELFMCFIEFFFHRYVLHKSAIHFLSYFYKSHTKHHTLTRIGKRQTSIGREIPCIENIYPITEPKQAEASFFPWYSLPVFSVVISPVIILLQLLVPSYPWFVGGNLALLTSLTLYEFVHAIEHWKKCWWDRLIDSPRFGNFWRRIYSFHLRHHAVIDCNESISGFFTIPVADMVFGTLIMPKTLYIDGGEWEESEFVSPRPIGLIRWLDERSQREVEKRRLKERVRKEFGG